jgi:hypothetical protein
LGGSHFLCFFLCLRHNGASHSIDDVASKRENIFFRLLVEFFVVISQNN